MLETGEIADIFNNGDYRIFTNRLTSINVILDEDGFYTTVGIGENGKQYFITL